MNIQPNLINLNPQPTGKKATGLSEVSGTDSTQNESENKQQSSIRPATFSDDTIQQEALFKSIESLEEGQKVTRDAFNAESSSQKAINTYIDNANLPQREALDEISSTLGIDIYS